VEADAAYDEYLDAMEREKDAEAEVGGPEPEASRENGHVDQAAAARWHQAQTELADLIREENRIVGQPAEAARVLPDSLADWMSTRVSQLEQASPELEASP
jgi:hypothetical protein